jgi:hypothetical protein
LGALAFENLEPTALIADNASPTIRDPGGMRIVLEMR